MYQLSITVYSEQAGEEQVNSFQCKYNTAIYALSVAQRFVRSIEKDADVVQVSLEVTYVENRY